MTLAQIIVASSPYVAALIGAAAVVLAVSIIHENWRMRRAIQRRVDDLFRSLERVA